MHPSVKNGLNTIFPSSIQPIMTKLKLNSPQNETPHWQKCTSLYFAQYSVRAPLAAITASSHLGYDANSFAHMDLGIFCHSSLQILLICRVGWGPWVDIAIFRSLQRCLIGFKSGLWLCHSRTLAEFYYATPVSSGLCAQGHRPVGRWTFGPVWGPEHSGPVFILRISLYSLYISAPFIFPSTPNLSSETRPPTARCCHRHALSLVLGRWWSVPGFLQTGRLELWPNI